MGASVVVGASVLAVAGAPVVVVVVVVGVVAAWLQVTLQPLAPAPAFLPLLVNSTTMSEVEVKTNFFFFPQTLNRNKSREKLSI